MKIVAAILAFCVILLSTQPMLNVGKGSASDNCAKAMSCCKKKTSHCEKSQKKEESNNGCKEMCNPFMPCGNCCYMVTEGEGLSSLSSSKCIKAGRRLVTFISQYQSEFWHPPNMA